MANVGDLGLGVWKEILENEAREMRQLGLNEETRVAARQRFNRIGPRPAANAYIQLNWPSTNGLAGTLEEVTQKARAWRKNLSTRDHRRHLDTYRLALNGISMSFSQHPLSIIAHSLMLHRLVEGSPVGKGSCNLLDVRQIEPRQSIEKPP